MSVPCSFDFASLIEVHEFEISPSPVAPLESATLTWRVGFPLGDSVDNVTVHLTIDGADVAASGSMTVSVLETTTYTLGFYITGIQCDVTRWVLRQATLSVDLGLRWAGEIKHLGLNGLKLDQGGIWGENHAQLDDAAELRTDSVRQPGELDLIWQFLARDRASATANAYFPVPVSDSDIRSLVVHNRYHGVTNVERFARLFRHLKDRGLKMRATFLTLGMGATPISGGAAAQGVNSAPPLDWAADHADRVIEVDGESLAFGTGAGATGVWNLATLDVQNAYKRYYIGVIAAAVGELLIAVETEVRGTAGYADFTLRQVLPSVEIFNEIDATGQRIALGAYDAAASADDWARAIVAAVGELRPALAASAGERPVLHLPGLSSYDDTAAPFSWSYRQDFFAALLDALATVEPHCKTVLHAVDYHWYHHDTTKLGPHHIAYLYYEVAWLREKLDDKGFVVTNVSVLENGMSAVDTTVSPAVQDRTTRQRQARQVWRRVGGALGAHARAAGWHAWMAAGGDYDGFGLRLDTHGSTSADSVRRSSWYAYHRLARYLGGVNKSHLVAPRPPSRADLAGAVDADYLTIFAYDLDAAHYAPAANGDAYRYAYLVFVDDAGGTTATLTATAAAEHETLLHRVPTLPSAIHTQSAGNVASGDLPIGEAKWAAPVDSSLGAGDTTTVSLTKDDDPILILATRWLAWTVPGASW